MTTKAKEVAGKSITLKHEHIGQVTAEAAHVSYCGTKEVNAGSVEISNSGVQRVSSQKAVVGRSVIGLLRSDEVSLEQSAAFAVQAKAIRSPEIRAVMVNAGEVHGNVQTMFDREGALAFGLGLGAVLVVFRFLRALFGR